MCAWAHARDPGCCWHGCSPRVPSGMHTIASHACCQGLLRAGLFAFSICPRLRDMPSFRVSAFMCTCACSWLGFGRNRGFSCSACRLVACKHSLNQKIPRCCTFFGAFLIFCLPIHFRGNIFPRLAHGTFRRVEEPLVRATMRCWFALLYDRP